MSCDLKYMIDKLYMYKICIHINSKTYIISSENINSIVYKLYDYDIYYNFESLFDSSNKSINDIKYVCKSFEFIINKINIIINSINDSQNLELITTDDSNNTHAKIYLFGYGKTIFTKLKILYIKTFLKSTRMNIAKQFLQASPHMCRSSKYIKKIVNKYHSLNLCSNLPIDIYEDTIVFDHFILMMLDKYKNIYKSYSQRYYCVLIPNYDLTYTFDPSESLNDTVDTINHLLINIHLNYFDSIFESKLYIEYLVIKYDDPKMKVSNLYIYDDIMNPYDGKYTQIEFFVDNKLVSTLIYLFNDYIESYVNNYYN